MTPEPRDVIAAAIEEFMVHPLETFVATENVLAALKAAGYETYRPDTHRLYSIVPEPYHPPAYPTLEPASDDTEGE